MRNRILCFVGIMSLLLLCNNFTFAAAPKKLKPIKTWRGSVADVSLLKKVPKTRYITKKMHLEDLWKSWAVSKEVPKVNFDKEIILISTTRGSRLSANPLLDDSGNLRVLGLATRDLRPGFRYIILQVSRAGVKKVNGKEIK